MDSHSSQVQAGLQRQIQIDNCYNEVGFEHSVGTLMADIGHSLAVNNNRVDQNCQYFAQLPEKVEN